MLNNWLLGTAANGSAGRVNHPRILLRQNYTVLVAIAPDVQVGSIRFICYFT